MVQNKDYAQLSLYVYFVHDKNKIYLPEGWTGTRYPDDPASGFSYGIFESGNEIVISYTGTNEGVDWLANAGNGSGLGSDQLVLGDRPRFSLFKLRGLRGRRSVLRVPRTWRGSVVMPASLA